VNTRERLLALACAASIGAIAVQQTRIYLLKNELQAELSQTGKATPKVAGGATGDNTIARLQADLIAETAARVEAERERDLLSSQVPDATAHTDPIEGTRDASAPPPPPPPTIEQFRTSLKELTDLGIGVYKSKKTGRLIKDAEAIGDEAVIEIGVLLLEGRDASQRFAAALLLGKISDPVAVELLSQSLDKETDRLVRRMASHALAGIGDERAVPTLQKLSDDPDVGVRINAAFGLADAEVEGGLQAYQGLYDSDETDGFMKTALLGGFIKLKSPQAVPFLERVYFESNDLKGKFIVITALGETQTAESADLLERIIATEPEDSVFDAAKAAHKKATGNAPPQAEKK